MLYRLNRIVPMEIVPEPGFAIAEVAPADAPAWLHAGSGTEQVFCLTDAAGEVIGAAAVGHAEGKSALTGLYVAEAVRRRGYGTLLCRYALKIIRRWDELPVTAQVPDDGAEAAALLAKLGFQPQTEQTIDLTAIRYDDKGLVPAVAQDAKTGAVLMLAYMNEESLRATLDSGYATYFSRSRQKLWRKGETSGHLQKILAIRYDCDGDAILLTVEQTGPACHTGQYTCFHNDLVAADPAQMPATAEVIRQVYDVIADRAANPKPGSYTNYLLDKGKEKICKKVGEEASETIIAAMKDDPAALCAESGDLLYHLLVLLYRQGVTPQQLFDELAHRR